MTHLPLSRGTRYAVAFAAVGAAFLLGKTLDAATGLEHPLSFFSAAVLVAAVVGGFGPGLTATAVAAGIATVVFAHPAWSFRVDQAGDGVRLGLFVIEGAAVSALGSALASARRAVLPPGWPRYAVAVVYVAGVVGAKLPFAGVIGGDTPFLLFYAAVLAAAWAGPGRGCWPPAWPRWPPTCCSWRRSTACGSTPRPRRCNWPRSSLRGRSSASSARPCSRPGKRPAGRRACGGGPRPGSAGWSTACASMRCSPSTPAGRWPTGTPGRSC